MRKASETQEIEQAKNQSTKRGHSVLVLESTQQREFFRFLSGDLVEYDLTRINRQPISITYTEKQGMTELADPIKF